MPAESYSAFYPNDENWKEHWENMEAGNWGLKAMNVPEAWNYIENIKDDLNGISIGVLEIGTLDITHGDLKENLGDIIGGASEKDKGAEAHGTQVAGIIGAGYNNKCGITGIMMNNGKINYFSYNRAKENNYPLYVNSSKGNRIDIVVPATHVESTTFGNRYVQDLEGTSFAAPYVSGIAGLMLTVNPDLSGKELKKLLIETGTGKYNFGMNGEIHEVPLADACRAVEKAENYGKGGSVFENLPGQFEFSSGVGGWMTKLELNPDGSFTGQYYDADMGDVGAKYPKGTAYICNFTGCFTEPKQIDAYTYSMKLKSLELEKMPGEIYYEDNVKYICRSPYGFDNANEFMIYLPGSEISELPQGFLQWIYYRYGKDESIKTLPFYGIYNVDGESGFLEDK